MSTELANTHPTQGNTLDAKMRYAQALALSNLLPRQYQKQPANLLFALEYADALGVAPIHAITSIHVIEGKPSASADLIAAMVRKAGHKLRITGDDRQCTAVLIRQDDPDFEFRAAWTMDKAKAANLTGKDVWRKYPGAMLRSRAITEVARMGAPDALYGVIYTPEELDAPVDESGEPILNEAPPEPTPRPRPSVRQRRQPAPPVPVPDVTTAPAPEPAAEEPAEATEPAATTAQVTKINIMLQEFGKTERADKLMFLTDWAGRTISSSKDLTKAEAHRFIEDYDNSPVSEPAPLQDMGETEPPADHWGAYTPDE